MNLGQALVYFVAESLAGLRRSWRVGLLSVLTMAVTLFLCGGFLLAAQNLSGLLREWRQGLRVIVYLEESTTAEDVEALDRELREAAWVRGLEVVDPRQAGERFRKAFPSLADVTEAWETSPFPTSYEVSIEATAAEPAAFDAWLAGLRRSPAVEMVDADRDWLDQLSAIVRLISVAGLVVGGIFLAAAVLTAASILRLTAHLQREETSIMRLVGATEFYVRGPFYVSGLLQGLCGGVVAVIGLAIVVLVSRSSDESLWSGLLLADYLSVPASLTLAGVGGAAGLLGAILALRRERESSESVGP